MLFRSFYAACQNMTKVTALPTGFMDTSGLTGSPAVSMFNIACYGMSGVTALPTDFLNTSGLTGAPAVSMFYQACYNMTGVTNGNVYVGAGVTLTTTNLTSTACLTSTMQGASRWTGQMYWGTNVIHTVITPTNDLDTFAGCVLMPDYATINANWK